MATAEQNTSDLGIAIRTVAAEQQLFSRYTLRKVLGRGGMGIVWLAHDDELKRNVAMKFLPDMIIRDREAVEDLKRETRRSLDLTHHHIVRIYDFTQDDSCAAIVMEYVDGDSLSALKTHQEGGCFGVSTIQNWVGHFCQAMDYAHRQARVVHRDLKPANLMVNGRGDLKVTDFGISRSMSDSMTRVSMSNSAGTLAYMSPEQSLGSPPAAGDDIYAFGATVYDLLTGRPPFFRGNLQVQLETVIPPPMEQRRTELGNTS
jgi:serine/threonine protein kinase